jgi:molybdopterin converting factor subunit 1
LRIRVLLFARLRELADRDSFEMEVPDRSTLAAVWSRLQEEHAGLKAFRSPPLMTRSLEYATPETVVEAGEEVAFFPPVSGG